MASLEERARRLAHEHGPRVGTPDERLELRPRLAFGLVVDPDRAADPGDQDVAGVQTNADALELRRASAGVRRDLRDRQGRVRRRAGGVLDRLKPEHRHEPPRAHLLDLTAEALDLLDQSLEHGTRVGHRPRRRRHNEVSPEQSDMPAFPLQRTRSCGGCGLDCDIHRLGRCGRLGCSRGRAQPVLLQAVAQGIASDPEPLRRVGDVPAGLVKHFQDAHPLDLFDRLLERYPLARTVEEVERVRILEVLHQTRWNISHAAERLGGTRNTLRYRLQKYGLRPPAGTAEPTAPAEPMNSTVKPATAARPLTLQ